MEYARLKEILAAFADDPTAIHFERGNLIVQIQSELISARVLSGESGVIIEEGGVTLSAERWIATRIAHLDQLAHNITNSITQCKDFIMPCGKLLDQLEFSNADDTPVHVDDAVKATAETVSRKIPGVCSVLYLTSDAGEGKTTLINQIALTQARLYRERKSDWLLVPISLGGNPFLRLDNVIAAALLNQLRFRRLYFEGFMQLVRLGFIVLALDGFEEVFVETASDAVSSLGNLISDLKGEGSLLVAARTAYFDFRRLDQQGKLIDAITGFEVGFAKVELERWGQSEFVSLCELNGIEDGHELYLELTVKLGVNHPLLTRAVFVRRMVDLAMVDEGLSFVTHTDDVNDLFHPFIDTILRREIESKWIDKFSDIASPLLTLAEHHGLLQLIAEEMWLSKRSSLPLDTCDSLAEIFCESEKKSPTVSRQVRERLSNHALLVSDTNRSQVLFDHDHFREFFLGELLGSYVLKGSQPDLRKLMRVDLLQHFALDIAVSYCLTQGGDPRALAHSVLDVASTEGPASFLRVNAGALIIRLLARSDSQGDVIDISDVTFPVDALSNRRITDIRFVGCYFHSTELPEGVSRTTFESCDFEDLQVASHARFVSVSFKDSDVRVLTFLKNGGTGIEYFDPKLIGSLLTSHGASVSVGNKAVVSAIVLADDDKELGCIRRLLSVFGRSLATSENVLTMKLGVQAPWFFSDLLPDLMRIGVVSEVPHRGSGGQRRFKLGLPLGDISNALSAANGGYSAFRKAILRP